MDRNSKYVLMSAQVIAIQCSCCVLISRPNINANMLDERIVPRNREVMNKPEAVPVCDLLTNEYNKRVASKLHLRAMACVVLRPPACNGCANDSKSSNRQHNKSYRLRIELLYIL